MELGFEDEATRRLRRYAALVADALGLHGDSSCVELEHPCSVYLAIDGHLPQFPDDDLALVWTERRGWCAVTEPPGGGRLREVARLDGRVNAAPKAVAAWIRGLLLTGWPGTPDLGGSGVPGHGRQTASARSHTRCRPIAVISSAG